MLTFRLESGTWLNVLAAEIEETGELVVDFRDVSEAKALEEAKDLFLATTSHELRTPITVVQGFASTLVNRWDEMADGDRRAAVATIAERAQSLGRLVEHLLLGSRAGADELAVTIEAFDLTRVLEGVVAGFRSLSPLHRVELDVEPGLPPCRGTRWRPTSSSGSCWRTRSSTPRTAGRSASAPAARAPASSSP
ncbi:histidine kinase dimerization/phospho-acceptor domain-containing protein [Actinomadura madurae]|uniref:histidine kinase dimerization/phospho-acceptor domain-containing protein n=1 Tax=Actinomadura madurae TaxID=1993 RepID=UPI003557DCD3